MEEKKTKSKAWLVIEIVILSLFVLFFKFYRNSPTNTKKGRKKSPYKLNI